LRTIAILKILFAMALFLAMVTTTPAQVSPYAIGPPPPPPGNHLAPPWFLLYWQCDPLKCFSNSGIPWYSGTVSTNALGQCADGLVITVGANAFLTNCTTPYYLESSAMKQETSRWYKWPSGLLQLEHLEGLSAISSALDQNQVQVGSYFQLKFCDGEVRISVPEIAPC
jgi:hypothetical protein